MNMEEIIMKIYEEMQEIKSDIAEVKKDLEETKNKVTDIQLTLENETNRNIQVIAEGHAMVTEKIDRELSFSKEKEMLALRLNHLENEVRRLKAGQKTA